MEDLTHPFGTMGEIGRLMTVARIPTLPGDSMGILIEGDLNLSPMIRRTVLDTKVECLGFWLPDRWAAASEEAWLEMLRRGNQPGTGGFAASNPPEWSVVNAGHTDVPAWLYKDGGTRINRNIIEGYNRIWDKWFRDPQDDELDKHNFPRTEKDRKYGYRCGNLQTLLSTGRKFSVAGVDQADSVPTSGAELSLYTINHAVLNYRAAQRRETTAIRPEEVMREIFHGSIPKDVSYQPELLFHEEAWMSGYTARGVADQNLGHARGGGAMVFGAQMPEKFFTEHGMIWVVMLLRFPPVFMEERHRNDQPLSAWTEFEYHRRIMEPGLSDLRQKEDWRETDFFANAGGLTAIVEFPAGMQFRTHPAAIHPDFGQPRIKGFPYINSDTIRSASDYWYCQDYGKDGLDVFESEQLAQWQWSGMCRVSAKRYLASPMESLMLRGGAF